jgi:histidyl-tRNA synthetase
MDQKKGLLEQGLQPPRGMRDFFPDEMRQREWVNNIWKESALLFGFEQYDASVVESLDLLKRKSGEEIAEQIYHFTDKSGRELALRPEMTPSLVRLVLLRRNALHFPLKWFSIPQCFRYERMTTGRKREHYQWNVDIIGESGQLAEAEILAVATSALRRMCLNEDQVVVKVGSRQLLVDLFASRDLPLAKVSLASLILDKRGKITDDVIRDMLVQESFNSDEVKSIFEILAIKSFEEASALAGTKSQGVQQLKQLFEFAETLNFSKFLQFDISVIRGLSYYTGIVFEAFDRAGKFRAIFGGGRYDKLFESMSGLHIPAVGFGFGDVVVGHVLMHYKNTLQHFQRELTIISYTDCIL